MPRRCRRCADSRAIVSGSCSEATNAQVADFVRAGGAARRIDPLALGNGEDAAVASQIAQWAAREWAERPEKPVLVYSTAPPDAVAAAQARGGAGDVGARLESRLAAVARALVERGARLLVVAGGETAGACVQALAIGSLRIGAQIDPGVPWCQRRAGARARRAAARAQVGQLRRGRFLHARFRDRDMNEAKLREELAASADRSTRAATSTRRPAT